MDKILEILKEDARTSAKDIAVMLGLTEEEVKCKIKEYEDKGVILKYSAIINEEKVSEEKVTAFIEVNVIPERGRGFDAIAERIDRFPQVKSLYLMSGAYDFLIVVEGENIKDVAMFVSEKLSTLEFVSKTATHFFLKKYKENGVNMMLENDGDHRIAVMP